MSKLITLDSNIFISETKKNEQYSELCKDIISRIGSDFYLVEHSVILAEIGNAIGRNVNIRSAVRLPMFD